MMTVALQDAGGSVVDRGDNASPVMSHGALQVDFLKGLVNDLTNYCVQGLDLARYPCISKISPSGVTILQRSEMRQFVGEVREIMEWAAMEYGDKLYEAHKPGYERLIAMAQMCQESEGLSLKIVGD